jgi:hypothetical protein
MEVRRAADEVAVAGGEDNFAMAVLFELSSGGLLDSCHDGSGKDSAPWIID